MVRPAGITAISVVLFVVSGIAMIMGAVALFIPSEQVAISIAVMIGGVLAAFTAVGLLRLQRWARLSLLSFSGLVVSWCVLAAPTLLFFPPPEVPGVADQVIEFAKAAALVFFAVLLALALWWIYFLNSDTSKKSFGCHTADSGTRSTSTTLVAWLLIVSGILSAGASIVHGPANLFGWTLTAWQSSIVWLIAFIAELYLGIGLLRSRRWSRQFTVYFFIFELLQSAVFLVRPDREERMADYYRAVSAFYESRSHVHMRPNMSQVSASLWFWLIEWGICALFAIFVLTKHRTEIPTA